ncbi:MAG: LCP family protein [Sporichthyaceae bacterium]
MRDEDAQSEPWFRDEAATTRMPAFPPVAAARAAEPRPVRPAANPTLVLPAIDARQSAPVRPQGPDGPVRPPKAPRSRRRRPRRLLAIALVMFLLLPVGLLVFADQKLERRSVWPTAARPAVTPGSDWLIVGSDSREGLSRAERRQLATGGATGQRTDTMMLLHIPDGDGGPTLVSLPRDSYVAIPGHGQNRLNAAYAIGGPQLLVQTVESVTKIRIDHYAEIGFAGLFDLVNTLGGVDMCLENAINDPKAGLNVKAGCQELDGQQALGYSRTRASTRGDLDRVGHQRELIAAIVAKATNPTTLLNPVKAWGLATDGPKSIAVADGDHITDLARLAWAMRSLGSDGTTTTVPIAADRRVGGADVLTWDAKRSAALFDALRNDRPVPKSSIAT